MFTGYPAFAQDSLYQASPYYSARQYSAVIDYLLNSGKLNIRHPLSQPFCAAELYHKLKNNTLNSYSNKWGQLIYKDISRVYLPGKSDTDGIMHLGTHGAYRLISDSDNSFSQYRVELYGTYTLPYLVLVNRTITDQQLRDDADFHGDTGEWAYGRVQDSYVLFKYKAMQFFAGRVSRNFGIMNEPSLILSDNPYSYDHFGFQVETQKFNFQFYATRLNDMMAFDSQSEDSTLQTSKRFMSVQRGEINLFKNLSLGFSQAAIYGGPDQNFDMNFLNPMNLYYVNQRNNHIQISGLWAFDIYWKPLSNFTIYNQILIDDIIINNEPGQNDRNTHPSRNGITSKLVITDIVKEGSQISVRYNRVSNWTYMSYRTWENYVYYKKGLGYPENSIESVFFGIDYFGKPPFVFQSFFEYKRHGEQDILNVFGDTIEKFPRGVVEHCRTIGFKVQYIPSVYYNLDLVFNYNDYTNKINQPGYSDEAYRVNLVLNVAFSKGFQF